MLRAAGLPVVETGGWPSRGHGQLAGVRGVLWHHTATPAGAPGDYPSLDLVTTGRGDLPGPLCNLGLGRNGTWYCVAAGLAYHAGEGSHPGIASVPWPPAQIGSYRRGTAALLRAHGLGADRLIFHREWAPARKIDPIGLDPNAERRFVAEYLANPGGFLMALNDDEQRDLLARVRGLEQTHRQVNEMYGFLGGTPDVDGDGRKGDVALVDYRQIVLDKLESIERRLAALEAK